jgi:hypothetical protein
MNKTHAHSLTRLMDKVSELTMSMLIVLVMLAIVTLSEFVAESADKRVEIFAGQIFDLACAKIPSC